MEAGRYRAAATARLVAVGEPLPQAALRDEPDLAEGSGERGVAALELGEGRRRMCRLVISLLRGGGGSVTVCRTV